MAAPTPLSSPLRKEVLDYTRSCEHLLSSVMSPTHPQLSPEERQMVEYYLEELKTHLFAPQPR